MVECHKEALNGLNHLNNQTIHCIGQYFVYEKQDDRLSRRIKTELENRNALISDEAYNALKADTESVKPKMAIA